MWRGQRCGVTILGVTDARARSRQVAALFDKVAPFYEAVGVPWFNPIAERLVDEMDPVRGSHVLDIGCGRGAALAKLSEAVGSSGRVTGIDLSRGMLEKARQSVGLRGLHNVELFTMDASAPEFPPDSFNVALASLVAFFLPDPPAALNKWHDLLVPTGRLGISTFGNRDEEWKAVDSLFNPYLPPNLLDARTSGSTGHFADDGAVEALIANAGFEKVHTVNWELPVHFTGADQWRRWSMSHGFRVFWESVPAGEQDGVQERAADILGRRRGSDGMITLTQTIRMTFGTRSF